MTTENKAPGGGTTQLARVLAMMGSAHDGEVLNAARLAERLRRSMDKSWASLLSGNDTKRDNSDNAPLQAELHSWRERALALNTRLKQAHEDELRLEQRLMAAEERCKLADERITSAEARASSLALIGYLTAAWSPAAAISKRFRCKVSEVPQKLEEFGQAYGLSVWRRGGVHDEWLLIQPAAEELVQRWKDRLCKEERRSEAAAKSGSGTLLQQTAAARPPRPGSC